MAGVLVTFTSIRIASEWAGQKDVLEHGTLGDFEDRSDFNSNEVHSKASN